MPPRAREMRRMSCGSLLEQLRYDAEDYCPAATLAAALACAAECHRRLAVYDPAVVRKYRGRKEPELKAAAAAGDLYAADELALRVALVWLDASSRWAAEEGVALDVVSDLPPHPFGAEVPMPKERRAKYERGTRRRLQEVHKMPINRKKSPPMK